MSTTLALNDDLPDNVGPRPRLILGYVSEVLSAAENASVIVRLLGGVAIYVKCEEYRARMLECREPFSDIDLVVRREDIASLESCLRAMRFQQDEEVRLLFGHERRLFYSPDDIAVDVYIDKLTLCQDIPLRDRLMLDSPTLCCTDLFLSRAQAVALKPKDLFDLRVLLGAVSVRSSSYALDEQHIRDLCVRWRWWRTLKQNLVRFQHELPSVDDGRDGAISELLERLVQSLDQRHKPISWRVRNVFGDLLPWYTPVDE